VKHSVGWPRPWAWVLSLDWCLPGHDYVRQVRAILNLPVDITPLNLIGLGYPAENKDPRTQYEEDRAFTAELTARPEKRHTPLFHLRKKETSIGTDERGVIILELPRLTKSDYEAALACGNAVRESG